MSTTFVVGFGWVRANFLHSRLYLVLCFGFVLKTLLIIQECFSYCWAVLIESRPFSVSHSTPPASRLGIPKDLEEDRSTIANPYRPQGYSIPQGVILRKKKPGARGVCAVCLLLLGDWLIIGHLLVSSCFFFCITHISWVWFSLSFLPLFFFLFFKLTYLYLNPKFLHFYPFTSLFDTSQWEPV